MADFTEIINIQINTSEAVKNEKLLTEAIVDQNIVIKKNIDEQKELEKTNKALGKEVKEGTKTEEDATEEIEKNTKKLKEAKIQQIGNRDELARLNKERREAKKVVDLQNLKFIILTS